MLLTLLPDTWSTFITTVNATGGMISSETLPAWIMDEDHICHAGSTKQTTLQAKGWKLKSEQLGTTKGKFWNCGKKGHYVKDCWEKGGGKEGQAPAWFKQLKEEELAM